MQEGHKAANKVQRKLNTIPKHSLVLNSLSQLSTKEEISEDFIVHTITFIF